VVVLDNLSVHKGERVRQAMEARGCQVLFLPAYSPDLTPIEAAFSKLKTWLRRLAARSSFGAGGSHRRCTQADHGAGCARLVLALWLPAKEARQGESRCSASSIAQLFCVPL
jgi:DDE superfamily endonuclease